jgi:inorganic pyrophosphatase
MTHFWHGLPAGADPPAEVTAVIEIPARSRNKYELDKGSGYFRLDRVLYSAVHYPGDYGFVPRTVADDGDPSDVLVLMKEPTFSGCLIPVRPIGVLAMLDRGVPDDKILAVPAHDPSQSEVMDLGDLPPHVLREIAHFFAVYKDLEGKRVEIIGWQGAAVAYQSVDLAMERYHAQFPSDGVPSGKGISSRHAAAT